VSRAARRTGRAVALEDDLRAQALGDSHREEELRENLGRQLRGERPWGSLGWARGREERAGADGRVGSCMGNGEVQTDG